MLRPRTLKALVNACICEDHLFVLFCECERARKVLSGFFVPVEGIGEALGRILSTHTWTTATNWGLHASNQFTPTTLGLQRIYASIRRSPPQKRKLNSIPTCRYMNNLIRSKKIATACYEKSPEGRLQEYRVRRGALKFDQNLQDLVSDS
jgi:hypothetical protein